MYETVFYLPERRNWIDEDREVTKESMKEYGMAFIDETDGKPVKSPFQQKQYFGEQSWKILEKMTDEQLDYCAKIMDKIARKLPQNGVLDHVEHDILTAQLSGYIDAVAAICNYTNEEKKWLNWYFSEKDGTNDVMDLKRERRLNQPKEVTRIEVPAGENTCLVAEVNPDPDYHEIFIGLEYRKGQVRTWMQDVAVVGQEYTYPKDSDKPVPTPKRFSVKAYGDSESEDFTEDVLIVQREAE